MSSTGDSRNPQFFRFSDQLGFSFCWESNRTGSWQIFGSSGHIVQDSIQWDLPEGMLELPAGSDYHGAAFTTTPITMAKSTQRLFFPGFTAGTMKSSQALNSEIVTLSWGSFSPPSYFSACDSFTIRNPVLSCGVGTNPFRVWSVWEGYCAGHWTLYGISGDFILGVVEGETEPQVYSLEQNHPNPFNPSTSISFTIPKRTYVRLQVFDVLGRPVETLVNEERQSGTYRVTWNSTNMSTGLYFYRIVAGNFVKTRKAVLVR